MKVKTYRERTHDNRAGELYGEQQIIVPSNDKHEALAQAACLFYHTGDTAEIVAVPHDSDEHRVKSLRRRCRWSFWLQGQPLLWVTTEHTARLFCID